MRYLWEPKPTEIGRRVWRLHINLLSRYESEMVDAVTVLPGLWRLDLREPRWGLDVWEAIADIDCYFHETVRFESQTTLRTYWPGGIDPRDKKKYEKGRYPLTVRAGRRHFLHAPWLPQLDILRLRQLTYSEAPIVSAPWLLAQTCRVRDRLNRDKTGVDYYAFLQIKTRDDYFKLIGFDARGSEIFGKEFRDAMEESGVSPQNRQVGRGAALGGGAWFTLDTDRQEKDGVALDTLKPGQFRHVAEEWYGAGSNGLPKMIASDAKGVLQAVVPSDNLGLGDRSTLNESKDPRIHPFISCIRCHGEKVLKPFEGDVRKQFGKGGWLISGATKKKGDLLFKRLYLSDLYKELNKDILAYQEAMTKATTFPKVREDDPPDKGLTSAQAIKAYARYYHAYADDPVTLSTAARELGVTDTVWLNALRHYAKPLDMATLSDNPLARFLRKEPLTISRLTWEAKYALAQKILIGYSTLPGKGR
jgi:hypothetical protein